MALIAQHVLYAGAPEPCNRFESERNSTEPSRSARLPLIPLASLGTFPRKWGRETHPTPSFLCKLVDDVVYWNTSFLSG
jgi:hypothetical protein